MKKTSLAFLKPALFVAFTAFIAGCGDEPTFSAPDRAEGDRTPQSAACGDSDEMRCLLPWPSSHYLEKDPTSKTGVRISVAPTSLQFEDDPASLSLADGFSRITPIVAGFKSPLDPASVGAPGSTSMRLLLAQHDHPKKGESVPLRMTTIPGEDPVTETLVLGYPLRPLEPAADYVAVVMDDLRADGGGALTASRTTRIALGLDKAASQEEADLYGYHAPTRALLEKAGIDLNRVLRVFDFTTRSADDALKRLKDMREAAIAAVDAGTVNVVVDSFDIPATPGIAAILKGRLTGLPSFREDDGDIAVDADGKVVQNGTREAPFRVMVPKGVGDYRFLMWGHGTGGDYDDDSFDDIIAGKGAGKVSIRFNGWTGDDLIGTFAAVVRVFEGTHRSTAALMTSIADGAAIERAMSKVIGDTLAAPTLGGGANPLASRRPDDSIPLWAGGSLGGTMGLVYASADPIMHHAVLNVPGAGWTHFVPGSDLYNTLRGLLRTSYGGDLDVGRALAMSQSNWDDIDGGVWADQYPDEKSVYCIQESMGDPILPNEGTALLSVATQAVQLGAVLGPIIGVDPAMTAENQTALTQFKVSSTDSLDRHGFAARSGPAGDAAREQMFNFVTSVWAGKPVITVPAGCVSGSCDFSNQ